MSLTLDEMFYLATGFKDIQSWRNQQPTDCHSSDCGTRRQWSRRASSSANSFACSSLSRHTSHRWIVTCFLLVGVVLSSQSVGACSSRSTPKPRPPPAATPSPSPALRPNVTFQTYACPPAYAAWYCLNGATCFTVKIAESILYNCECSEGYMGQRCEFKDLDGSYLPLREKILLERASIAGGASVAVILVVIVLTIFYACVRKKRKELPPTLAGDIVEVTVDRFMMRTSLTRKSNTTGPGSAQAKLARVDGRLDDDPVAGLGHTTPPSGWNTQPDGTPPGAQNHGSEAETDVRRASSTNLATT